jgi:rhombotail lipoprotein
MDLAVIDPASRSLLLRAGGTDTQHGDTTFVNDQRESRAARTQSFVNATHELIGNFDVALTRFETDVRNGKANVRVNHRTANGETASGAGAFDPLALTLMGVLLAIRCRSRQVMARRCL